MSSMKPVPTVDLETLSKRLDRLWDLQRMFYGLPNCSTGGPLHILLDDGNIRDSDLVFCYCNVHKDGVDPLVRTMGLLILHDLAFLSEAQRYLWWEHNTVENIARAEHGRIEITPTGYEVRYP